MRKENVHLWHLEMLDRSDLTGEDVARTYELKLVEEVLPELNRFLFLVVGAPWTWYSRLNWSYQQWSDYLAGHIQTWIAYKGATPIGYFELALEADKNVEIAYFGLLPEFIGKGHGKALLRDAINKAWEFGGERVWVHTCTLDHPQALSNYVARGFKVFNEEDVVEEIPTSAIQPWEGANKPLPNP